MAVDDRCGRVIATRNRDEDGVVQDMAHFLAGIMADRDSLDRLSESARARAASLTWQANVDAVYRDSAVLQAS
jgi:hypothetical protein